MALHALDNSRTFQAAYSESFKYTLDLDDPSPGTWTGHLQFEGGTVQIVDHLQFHTNADGNVTVDRKFGSSGRLLSEFVTLIPSAARRQGSH